MTTEETRTEQQIVKDYMRALGRKGKGASKVRNVDYNELSAKGVAARRAKLEKKSEV